MNSVSLHGALDTAAGEAVVWVRLERQLEACCHDSAELEPAIIDAFVGCVNACELRMVSLPDTRCDLTAPEAGGVTAPAEPAL